MPSGYESYYAYGAVESHSRFGLLGTEKA
jgi:hypothetical protein